MVWIFICMRLDLYDYCSIYFVLVQQYEYFLTQKSLTNTYISIISRGNFYQLSPIRYDLLRNQKRIWNQREAHSPLQEGIFPDSYCQPTPQFEDTHSQALIPQDTWESDHPWVLPSCCQIISNSKTKNPLRNEGIFDGDWLLVRTPRECPSTESDDCYIGIYIVAHTITAGSRCQDSRECWTSSHRCSHNRDRHTDNCLDTGIPCLRDSCHTRLWESSPCSCLLECPEWLRPLGHKWRQWNNSRSRNNNHSRSNWYWRRHDWSWLERIRTTREESERDDRYESDGFLHSWVDEDITTQQLYAISREMQDCGLYGIKWLLLKYPSS